MAVKTFSKRFIMSIREDRRKERRREIEAMCRRFVRERPGENAVRLAAKERCLSEKTVYDILAGRR